MPTFAASCATSPSPGLVVINTVAKSFMEYLSDTPAGTYTLTVTAEEPGKRTLGPETHQAISISENKAASLSIGPA